MFYSDFKPNIDSLNKLQLKRLFHLLTLQLPQRPLVSGNQHLNIRQLPRHEEGLPFSGVEYRKRLHKLQILGDVLLAVFLLAFWRAWLNHVTHICMRNCGLIKISRHGMPLSEVNNAVDGGPLTLAATTVDVNDATALSSISSNCYCICCKQQVCIICRRQID